MLVKVLQTIHKYNMLSAGERVVVGVSGGPDSVALLHVLKCLVQNLDIEVYAAHVNHGIRGTFADRDADFVAQLCQQWDVPLFVGKFDVPQLAGQWGVTLEEAGRIVRYRFFDKVLSDIKGDKIALGHHRDDQAETILHHVLRGTGMQGLQGMKPVRQHKFIRPLIDVSRDEIEDYCRQNGLVFQIDATNLDMAYTRNRIRHELIPYIEQNFNPNFVDALVRMGAIIRDEEEFLEVYCQQHYEKLVKVHGRDEIRIDMEGFQACPTAVKRRILRMAIKSLCGTLDGIHSNHIERLLDMVLRSQTGALLCLPNGVKGYQDYDSIVLFYEKCQHSIPDFQYSMDIPGEIVVKECGIEIVSRWVQYQQVSFSSSWCAYINGDAIKGRLRVRNRRQGDRFKPFGMNGTKKLKEYFIDNKVPRYERESIPLVVDEKNIIWVVGWQIHDDYKVTPQTRNIVQLKARRIL
jgi:tRNA(Ile)-lysidine synthase